MLPAVTGMTGILGHALLLVEMESYKLRRIMILLISASRVVRIIGVSHCAWLYTYF
jgi:hypothetical protein